MVKSRIRHYFHCSVTRAHVHSRIAVNVARAATLYCHGCRDRAALHIRLQPLPLLCGRAVSQGSFGQVLQLECIVCIPPPAPIAGIRWPISDRDHLIVALDLSATPRLIGTGRFTSNDVVVGLSVHEHCAVIFPPNAPITGGHQLQAHDLAVQDKMVLTHHALMLHSDTVVAPVCLGGLFSCSRNQALQNGHSSQGSHFSSFLANQPLTQLLQPTVQSWGVRSSTLLIRLVPRASTAKQSHNAFRGIRAPTRCSCHGRLSREGCCW